jgi:hypothetical protein
MKVFVQLLLLTIAVAGLLFYSNISQAQRIALYDSVPSTSELYKLQYCLEDSDCQVVKWHDCNQCQYSRSMNQRFSKYFYDNADYFNYPIGFNRHYCDALSQIASRAKQSGALMDLNQPKINCEYQQADLQKVVSSKCDPIIKQCYSICAGDNNTTHRCPYDRYDQKFYDVYLGPLIDPVGNKTTL